MVSNGAGRGREAARPREIPRSGWRDILLRVKDDISKNNLSMIAAGVAFYALLAIFPALAALVSIYGLIAEPADVQSQLQAVGGILPQEAQRIIEGQLTRVVTSSGTALSLGVALGLLLTVWSATAGTKALMTAMNFAYEEQETRSFLKFNALALALTLGGLIIGVIVIALVVAMPALLGSLGLGSLAQTLVSLLRWPLLAVVAMLALAAVYRFGPARRNPKWRWVTWGAIAATVVWLVGSIAFSIYIANFADYNKTYGSMGAVIILLMWFYVSAFVVLLGAALNAEMEHQTEEDSTVGRPRPMGKRGAHVADTVGEAP